MRSLEEGQEQGPEETGFLAALAGITNEEQSHSGSARGSRNIRQHIENGAADSADPKKGAGKGLDKAERAFGSFMPLGGQAGLRSERQDSVREGESAGSGLKPSLTGLNATNKRVQHLVRKEHKASMDLHKTDALKEESAGLGSERKEAVNPRGRYRIDADSKEWGQSPRRRVWRHHKGRQGITVLIV